MQAMDQGLIRLLKAKYRSLVVRRLIPSSENKASMPAISILSARMWLSKGWNTLPDKTFTNCFHKFGILEEAAASANSDDDSPFAGLEEGDEDAIKILEIDLQFLKTNFDSQVDEDLTIDHFDRGFCTNQSTSFGKGIANLRSF